MSITIRQATGSADIRIVRRLFTDYAQSLAIDLAYQGFEQELADLPGKYAPPTGALLIAFDEQDNPLGCVAVRPVESGACEMKRLYVGPEGRGTGAGRRLAEAAIKAARLIGYSEMLLDTLPTMAAAQGLYASLGFVQIESYYATPVEGTVFMRLLL
jgi:ribosomal protein S18 acetylase RimI-like enzyme